MKLGVARARLQTRFKILPRKSEGRKLLAWEPWVYGTVVDTSLNKQCELVDWIKLAQDMVR